MAKILCVPAISDIDDVVGYVNARGVYLERSIVETNYAYRQLIPYTVLFDRARGDNGKILAYKRQKTSSEGRLHDQLTIGIGGHVEENNGYGWPAVDNARRREMFEEIGVTPVHLQYRISIMLHETAVDRVHLGVASFCTKWAGELKPSDEIPEWRWHTIEELDKMPLESWSRYILDTMLGRV